jgi:Cu-Zn family superoxide dismutase
MNGHWKVELPLFLLAMLAILLLARRAISEPMVDYGFQVPAEVHSNKSSNSSTSEAVAVLQPVGGSGVRGVVHLTARGDSVEVRGTVTGLSQGKHGFHVHEYGDLTDSKEGKSAGDHYNPAHTQHGRPEDPQRHAGDFGNIEAGPNGTATVSFRDPVVRLAGPFSIVGRSLVVHAAPDRFTQPSGDAGARVAMGVIGIAQARQ